MTVAEARGILREAARQIQTVSSQPVLWLLCCTFMEESSYPQIFRDTRSAFSARVLVRCHG